MGVMVNTKMKLNNRQIGAAGVARVAGALFRNGYSVLVPMEDFGHGYDIVAEKDGKFFRIQVKTTAKAEDRKLHYRFMTCGGNGKKSTYTKSMLIILSAGQWTRICSGSLRRPIAKAQPKSFTQKQDHHGVS